MPQQPFFDRDGNVVAQAELIPMQLGPMSDIFRACAAVRTAGGIEKRGTFILITTLTGVASICRMSLFFPPIFVASELVGFAGTVSHHLDLGGGNPGLSPDAVDVHAEGIIFPPSVYNFSRDWNGGPLERLVAANIRVPDQTIGDFYAQFASNAIGAERVKQLCEKYGIDSVTRSMTELIDYSERRFRAALREVPDGEYFGEDAIDDDGLSDEPLVVKAKVTVQGDSVHVDFDGHLPSGPAQPELPVGHRRSRQRSLRSRRR